MANRKKVAQARIEKKYSKLIAQALEEYKEKSISELCDRLDELKEEMKAEFIKCNLPI